MNPLLTPFHHEQAASRDPFWWRFLLCCYVAIAFVRMSIIQHYGASVPFMDEWVATGPHVLANWAQGTFTTGMLFDAHLGDHRIVATRLWDILWFEINGAWDPKLVMQAKTLIYAAAATLFVHLLSRGLDRSRYLAAALFAVLFAIPFGYQNLLWAFQSQFDFFMLAVAGGWLALLSGRHVLALVIAALAPFTLGAGPLLAASFLVFAVLAFKSRGWPVRRCLWFAGTAVLIVIGGVLLRTAEGAPPHTFDEKLFALVNYLGWPYSNLVLLVHRLPETIHFFPTAALNFPSAENSWLVQAGALMRDHRAVAIGIAALLSCLMLMPIAALVLRARMLGRIPPSAWGPLALAAFALLLQGAMGLVRSGELTVPARYLDVVALTGIAAMGAAFSVMAQERRLRRVMLLWFALLAPGYLITTYASFKQMKKANWPQMLAGVQAYFPGHDRSVLPLNTNWQLPYFLEADPNEFANILDNPGVEAILPSSVTQPAAGPRPVARAAEAIARRGWMVSLLAAIAGAFVAIRAGRQRSEAATPPVRLTSLASN